MTKIKLDTLTDVHVGSGKELYEGQDFFMSDNNDYVNVVDVNKMGAEIAPEYVDNWVSMINAGKSIHEIMQRFAHDVPLQDFTKYRIENYANIKPHEAMKEQLRDGRGLPYIPGSSIKGAIRTAVLSTLAGEKQKDITEQNFNYFEADNLGDKPNNSLFRFLQVGDSYFKSNDSVIVVKTKKLNLRDSYDDLHDSHISQLLEVIASNEQSEFTLKLDVAKYEKVQRRFDLNVLPKCMSSVGSLFHAINEHTKQLLNKEIDFWKEVNKIGSDDYLNNVKEILDAASECIDGKECVLRIGAGSGWRFTTGAWTESYSFFEDKVVRKSRRNAVDYEGYPFPKTRTIESQDDLLLGFVKLTVLGND